MMLSILLAAISVLPADRLAMADRLFNKGLYAEAAVEYEALKEFMLGSLMQSVTPWNGGTFTAAPEPTGGVLVLLGLGVLGLRRRRIV